MSVIGLDVGNANCVVGMVREQGVAPNLNCIIDIALNEESNQETPALVSFTSKQRLFGSTATLSQLKDPRNTISQVKRLIGRKFNDPVVQNDIKRFPCKVIENKCDGPDKGSLLIRVKCFLDGELRKRELTPTQIMAMTLSNLKSIAEKNTEGSVENCVIAIPVYFTHAQRQAYLNAAAIAGLRPLCLMHETTATALAYGIYHKEFPPKKPRYVVFIDIGHSSMQVCVVSFKTCQGKVLGHGFDCSLGGRDFDAVLFDHFADEFKKKYKIDVTSNRKASQRLLAACEKLKKVLSANPEAPLSIECLMEEKDVSGFITRKEFENLASSLLDRVRGPCHRALEKAELTVDDIHSIELVGSGFRIPAILNILSNFFHKELRRTMNASECVARGCTLRCAIFTPSFQVREFKIHDSFPCPIKVSWEGQGTVADGTAGDNQSAEATFFKTGDIFPNTKILYFFRSNKFDISVSYMMDGMDSPRKFTISPRMPTKGEKPKIKVKICLNRHGMVSVASSFPDDSGAPANKAASYSDAVDNTGTKTGSKWNDLPEKVVVVKVLEGDELEKAQKVEKYMKQQDDDMEEIKFNKNDLEAYVYGTRLKLNEKYEKHPNYLIIQELLRELDEVENWLYGEGKDVGKAEYKTKLVRLEKKWDSIEEIFKAKYTLNQNTSGVGQCRMQENIEEYIPNQSRGLAEMKQSFNATYPDRGSNNHDQTDTKGKKKAEEEKEKEKIMPPCQGHQDLQATKSRSMDSKGKQGFKMTIGTDRNWWKLPSHPSLPKGMTLAVIVLDGWGEQVNNQFNAIHMANTPTIDSLKKGAPGHWRLLKAHGLAVGLPTDEDTGNCEVGHNALGAGRIVKQGASLVEEAIVSGKLFKGEGFKYIHKCFRNGTLHLIVLLTYGVVYSRYDQIKGFINGAAANGAKKIRVHFLIDNCDGTSFKFVEELENNLAELRNKKVDALIASGVDATMSRYENDWIVVMKSAWDVHVLGEAPHRFQSALKGIQKLKEANSKFNDQYFPSFVVTNSQGQSVGSVQDKDAVVTLNFEDKCMKILAMALQDKNFSKFERKRVPKIHYASMLQFDSNPNIRHHYLVSPPEIHRTSGEYLVKNGLRTFACSETVKFGHVTFSWNGNRSGIFSEELETYKEIPSYSDIDFNQRPRMRSADIAEKARWAILSKTYNQVRVNLPNGDMMANTGDLHATIISCTAADQAVKIILDAIEEVGGIYLVTSDHGNAEDMAKRNPKTKEPILDKYGNIPILTSPTCSTCSLVPIAIGGPGLSKKVRFRNDLPGAGLANVAATTINLLGFVAPHNYEPSLIEVLD